MKILSVGAELLPADGQTDKKKVIVAFRNFANALKNVALYFQFRFFLYLFGTASEHNQLGTWFMFLKTDRTTSFLTTYHEFQTLRLQYDAL